MHTTFETRKIDEKMNIISNKLTFSCLLLELIDLRILGFQDFCAAPPHSPPFADSGANSQVLVSAGLADSEPLWAWSTIEQHGLATWDPLHRPPPLPSTTTLRTPPISRWNCWTGSSNKTHRPLMNISHKVRDSDQLSKENVQFIFKSIGRATTSCRPTCDSGSTTYSH